MAHGVSLDPTDNTNPIWRFTIQRENEMDTGVEWSRNFYLVAIGGGTGAGPDDAFMVDVATAISGIDRVITSDGYKIVADITVLT